MSNLLTRILYVEDDEDIAEIATMTLEDMGGYDINHCPSGQNALDTFATYSPQLILMDVMMPNMDGPKTLAQLRLLPNGTHIPVIFMTAKAQTHEQATYKAMGGVLGVIVKPFDPMTLCDQINALWTEFNDKH